MTANTTCATLMRCSAERSKRTIIRGGADPLLEETPHKRTMIRAVEELFGEEADGS